MGKAIFLSKYLNELSKKKKKKLPKSRKQLSTKAHALFKPLKRCSSIVSSSSANRRRSSTVFCDLPQSAAAAKHQFFGFMTFDYHLCSVRFCFKEEDDHSVDLSVKHVDCLNHLEVLKVFHCDGLVLCVLKDSSKLVLWNPYLSETISISPRTSFHFSDRYALCNHKILRFYAYQFGLREGHIIFELYDFGSHSWKVLDVEPNFTIDYHQRGASLKGNTYFFGHGRMGDYEEDDDLDDFLLCFDFTTETFGPRLPLPFHSCFGETVTVSSVTQEKLAVLYQRPEDIELLEVWVTTEISPNSVSWSMFLKVDMKPLTGFQFYYEGGSFFVDEEKKAVVVFDKDGYNNHSSLETRYHTAFVIGEDGYFKTVNIAVARASLYCTPLVCSSSYLPSLVHIK
ncbi:unnamed protein product [Cochlearia groenlandica]